MFQTEPILLLQGLSSTLFHDLMWFSNQIGLTVATILTAVFLFGVNPKKGFILLHIVVVTAIITELLKDYFALPRPIYVDNNIQYLDTIKVNDSPFESMGATSFLGGLPQSVIDYYRASAMQHWGFPSGHVSNTLVFWFGLVLLYKRWLLSVATVLTILVALARLYFGKHFVADVLGGAVLGGLILSIAYRVILQPERINRFLAAHYRNAMSRSGTALYYGYLIFLPLLILFVSPVQQDSLACLLGLNGGFVVLYARGSITDVGGTAYRTLCGVVTVLILLLYAAFVQLAMAFGQQLPVIFELILLAASLFAFVISSVSVAGYIGRRASEA